MGRPRLSTAEKGVRPLDWMASRWAARYAVPVLALLCAWVVQLALHPLAGREADLLLLFTAILISSAAGGIGPGLVATALALLSGHLAQRAEAFGAGQASAQLWLLGGEGVMVSILGGTLLSARRKARAGLAANLELEQQILEISDDERRRIGHDLHDGLGQHLTGISLLTESMAQQVASGTTPSAAELETITRLTSEAVRITRDLARSLSPVTLERDGLIAAIEELAGTSTGLFGIRCEWECPQEELGLDRTRALHLYRIVQEAVSNSVKHGKAKTVRIRLAVEGGRMVVMVTDDGSGLSQKTTANPGLGLRIMQYRARMLDATLAVERLSPTGGTIVTCSCPVEGASAPARQERASQGAMRSEVEVT